MGLIAFGVSSESQKGTIEKNLAVDFSSLPEKIQNLLNFAQDRSTNRRNFENDMLDNESNSFDLFLLSLLQFSTFWGSGCGPSLNCS